METSSAWLAIPIIARVTFVISGCFALPLIFGACYLLTSSVSYIVYELYFVSKVLATSLIWVPSRTLVPVFYFCGELTWRYVIEYGSISNDDATLVTTGAVEIGIAIFAGLKLLFHLKKDNDNAPNSKWYLYVSFVLLVCCGTPVVFGTCYLLCWIVTSFAYVLYNASKRPILPVFDFCGRLTWYIAELYGAEPICSDDMFVAIGVVDIAILVNGLLIIAIYNSISKILELQDEARPEALPAREQVQEDTED